MKHTPGPWNFSTRVDYRIDSQNGLGRSVCTYLVDQETEAEDLANAHLIAAAPEMLNALELVMKLNSGAVYINGVDGEMYSEWEYASKIMRKAKGA